MGPPLEFFAAKRGTELQSAAVVVTGLSIVVAHGGRRGVVRDLELSSRTFRSLWMLGVGAPILLGGRCETGALVTSQTDQCVVRGHLDVSATDGERASSFLGREGANMATVEELGAELDLLTRRVEATESVLAIHALKARYAGLVDERFSKGRRVAEKRLTRIAKDVALLFTPQGVWDGGRGLGVARGRAEIAEMLAQPTLDFSRHFFVQPQIHVNGAEGSARWDLLSPCRRSDGTSYWMCGFEDDEYERVHGSWLFGSMRLTTVFMSPIGEGWDKIFS